MKKQVLFLVLLCVQAGFSCGEDEVAGIHGEVVARVYSVNGKYISQEQEILLLRIADSLNNKKHRLEENNLSSLCGCSPGGQKIEVAPQEWWHINWCGEDGILFHSASHRLTVWDPNKNALSAKIIVLNEQDTTLKEMLAKLILFPPNTLLVVRP